MYVLQHIKDVGTVCILERDNEAREEGENQERIIIRGNGWMDEEWVRRRSRIDSTKQGGSKETRDTTRKRQDRV